MSGELHALASLPVGKGLPVPIEYESGSAPEPFWTLWRRRYWLAPARNGSTRPCLSAHNVVTHWPCIYYSIFIIGNTSYNKSKGVSSNASGLFPGVPVSNLCPKPNYPEVFEAFHSCFRKVQCSASDYITTASFLILHISLFTTRIMQRYTTTENTTEKPQNKWVNK